MLIYKITNLINGKVYIGQTTQSLEKRWKDHCYTINKDYINSAISNALQKYGKDNFKIEKLISCDNIDHMNKCEIEEICRHDSIAPHGYNLQNGGHDNHVMHPDTIEKIRKANIGKKLSTAAKNKISNAHKGRKQDSTWIKKRIESRKNFKHSELSKNTIAIKKGGKKFKVFTVQNEYVGEWIIINQCARDLGIRAPHINSCLKGRLRQHEGYIFKYIQEKEAQVPE